MFVSDVCVLCGMLLPLWYTAGVASGTNRSPCRRGQWGFPTHILSSGAMPALKSEYVKLRARVLVAPHVIVGSVRLAGRFGPPGGCCECDCEQRACAQLSSCSHVQALRLCRRPRRRPLLRRHPTADRASGNVDSKGHHRQNRKVVTWPQPARHEEC